MQPFPQLERAAELAFLVVELGVRLIGLSLLVDRPFAHVWHAQASGNHQHLVERAALACLQNHAPHARIERQPRQRLTDRRQLVALVDCAQLGQQLVAVDDGAPLRRVDEGKVFHRAQAQRLHAQNHARQRAAQNFRVGEFRSPLKAGLVVEPDADAVGHAATAPGTLVGGRPADGLDLQLLDLLTKAVALDARGAGVDDEADPGHGERGLGHIGRQHDAACAVGLKNAVLLRLRQAGKQRQQLGAAQHRVVAEVLAQVIGGFPDFALAG